MSEQNGPAPAIAVVGMAGRFPGAAHAANNIERFWENLAAGVESVTFFRREELLAAGVDPAQLDDPAYVPARAALDGAELFDAELFGYSPREAELMDPQHRLLLECAWEALERAGCDPRRYGGLIGVYAGAGPNSYLLFNLIANREALASMGQFQTLLGNSGDFLASRLSYKLGLRGPSLTVQTACSTSLVAVHLAVQSLLNGECDLALAGGVRISVPRPAGYLYQADGVFSPDGHCRPFDAAAQGPVDGEGAGIVALKRLADALADGNFIHGVILGTAVNNDGDDRVGFTAPGVGGQAAVLALAQAVAGVHPETIGFVEGHGTATPLGDPIEVAALRQVFEASTSRKGFCALGSVKGNVGHLDAAAGAASLIKAVLALERGVIPPTPHFQRPNPQLGLEDSPFFVNAEPLLWPPGPEPRRAGVSSFGMGGTNAHAVLEEAPPIPPGTPSRPWQLLVLSAAGAPALEAMTDRLADHLARHPGLHLADVAFTLQVGRRELAHRRMLVCRSAAEAREALASRDPRSVFSGVVDEDRTGEAAVPDGDGPESLEALGRRWLAGAEVDWHALRAGERRLRVPLPAYPFQRKLYWIGARTAAPAAAQPAVPARRQPRPAMVTPYEAPRGDVEQRLAGLFEDLLGIAPVGAADNFFALGGHSLLGLQLLSRVKSEMGAEVRLEWLFQAASVADLAELIAVLEEEKRASFAADVIPRVPRDGDLPLSYAQERLWFLDRLEPGTPAFNLTESVRLTGVLDVPALGRALAEAVRRHESLRTAFVDLQGRPGQRILPAVDVPLPLVDLAGLPEERREAAAERLAVRSGERRFDLSRPPLLAAELYRLAPDRHAIVLVYHHIIGDGWSSTVLLSDLTQIYRAFAAGEPSPLPELPVQYADFASWQRTRLGDREMAEQLAGWRERLAPPLPVLDLPTDRPRPAVQSFRGMSEVLMLPPEVAASLHGLGAAEGATPFMVLLSAFGVVLSRWSGQEDLIVGSPVAGRDRLELERMIGIFLNMLPLRIDLSGDPAFRGLLGRMRETALAAYTRKEVPVERILEEVQPGRDLSRSPLFQVLFNFLAFPHPALDLPGLAIEEFPLRELPSRFDFTIYAEEIRTGEISLDLVYNAGLFDRATMAGFLAQLRRVLERAAAEPDTPISRISLLTAEAAAVLPDPRVPLAAGEWQGAVHERFAGQARLRPDRPAVVDAEGTWTYGELAERAGELARRLQDLGIGRGDVVAVLAERSAPLVQALLAVLEVDAAFLVLDPAHPETRRQAALRQAAPRARIEIAGGRLQVHAEGGGSLSRAAGEGRGGGSESLAWVAFTSGSTGEPKGILGTHGPLAHFCAWHAETFGLGADDRFSLLSGLAHDPLLRDVFTPLSLGATLCIPGPDDLGSPAGWMARQAITVCHLPPALGQVLADGGMALPALRWAFFGGDVLTERHVARLRSLAPGVVCVNFYGTTETPQAMAWHDASGAGGWPARRVPVGRGIDGVQLLVLNGAGDLAAPGELGEVCVRTPHLSIGYLGDERLTAERFVANPFTANPADRIYRTGDLGRYRCDGAVDLAGRRDRQIQVRGFRVEPAEVEAALALHPAVREAAVLHRGALTAWLAGAPGAPRPRPTEMREFLRRLLPDPMVPEAFVWLEHLPLTPNGKLDRAALPDPEPVRAAPGSTGSAAPRTPLETSLASIWREVLGIEDLGLEDNFFELGGHSLLATQVTSRVCEAFGIDLPLRVLFEVPTVGGLARRLEDLLESPVDCETGQPEPPPLRRVPRGRDLPLSFAQERLWFLAQLAPESPAYNMPFAVRLNGTLDSAALAAALSEIRRRHETLRTTFRLGAAGRPVQVIHPAGPLTLPLLDLSGLPEASRPGEARRVAGETALAPFDLTRGPLVRTLLFRLAPDEHVVLWGTHHVAADGWSMLAVFLPELGVLYAAFAQGLPSPLPELPVQHADFAVWQRSWLRGERLEEQIGYWRRTLAGAATLELPVDRPRRPVPSAHGASRPWSLPAAQTGKLRDLARAQGATLFMAVHAALAALLQRYTGQDDVVVGMPVANRTRSEIEGLIGFFVNTLVLRVDLSGEPDLPAAMARSRESALGAYAHQDLPFERLVEELGLPRDPYRPPLLRVLFQHQNAPAGDLELPGLTLAPFSLESATCRFELVVNLVEAPAGLKAVLTYDADLFEGATIARLCEHFETLLAAWIGDPGRPASDLPLLSAAERHQLVVEHNEGLAADRDRRCLHQRFEEEVDRAPDAPAVAMGSERLTYRELDERSNRLAHHLLARGVRPGDRVALALERSVGMVVAILAVLKAGAAYVPLDPAWPAERLAFALEDSGAALLIDADPAEIARCSGERPAVAADPALPIYVIYTSGSTGRPKGVVVSHANVDRLLTATAPWFGFGPADVWTLFHSYTFDFSVWELWGALLHGGRLVIVPYWESRSPEDFYRLLQEERVTVLNQTPSAFRQLLWAEEAVLGGAPPGLALRWVIFGGEALEPASLAPWFDRHGDERPSLVNMYGITETAVHVTFRPVRQSDLGRRSELGQPIPDLSVHILDRHLRPQPLGVPGEIYVGGEGLAQGYLGRPDFTAERFVPDPFSSEPGARLYRSGDLARRLPDGDLEYLGRIDHQVKIRGFRIELGEIEAVLASHPGVRESVVLAREDGGGTVRRLVAYAVPASDTAPEPADLRAFLAGRLPDYMVPSALVLLDQLPLTANGKIDRRALPPPEEAGPASLRKHVPPHTDLERYLAGQIREVLGLSEETEIGVEDDFFELGGNSINGAIFIHRLQDALREIVHIVTIFDHPTVASLAAYVKEEHPDAVRRIWGEGEERQEAEEAAVGPAEVEEMRRILVSARPDPDPEREELNPPALFLLSPPRSGSTLLRVMLGVHPGLFAPPELELLSFRTLAERSAAFQGRDGFWREGLVRAVMEARQVSASEAEQVLADRERQGWTTRRLYRELQGWLGERTLVDKTPSYALDPEVLRQAEAGFAGARYLHLVRHPQATLRSFEEARLDQIFFRRMHPFSRRQLAELVWTVSHRNIVDFLADVPRDRWMRVRFEELVREPQRVLQGICGFLGVEYRPEMAEPYRERAASMVDGPHAVSRMLGDVKFLAHGRVDPAAAERWREAGEVTLGAPAREIAAELGYLQAAPERGVLVPIQAGSPDRRPLFCVHPVGGEVVAYRELARRLPGETVYGLQSPGQPSEDLREMAALHVEAVRQVQSDGPYRLAGWSMGGAVALEMAGQLAELGERVELLALIDTVSPALWAQEPEPDEAGLVAAFALDLARLSRAPVPEVDLSGLDEDGALARVLRLGRDTGVLAPGVELAELRRLFERFRANRRAMSSHEPVSYAGEAILFRARERPAGREDSPDLGWRGLVAGLSVLEVPGDHYTILRDGVDVLAGHLRNRLSPAGQPGGRIPRLPRDNRPFPASASQLREWVLDRLQPGTGAYNIPGGGKVVGPADLAVLERSIQEIVRRHESLRTIFRVGGEGEPVQVVAPELRIPIPVADLSALPDEARETEARRVSGIEWNAPFDLERGPLVRVTVARLSGREHLLLVTLHHIISDGWSMMIFYRELAALYEAFAAGRPSPLPELPVQYADYAVWQRHLLAGESFEEQVGYWRRQLAGVAPLELPADRPRPPVQRFEGAKHPFRLPLEPAAGLREMAQRQGASLFMALLAAFCALLGRHSGQDDLTVGTYNGNRGRTELEGLIGFFINSLVLRLRLEGEPSFRQLLDRAREVTLEAFAHQDVPFEKLLEALRIERDLSRTPLFQVMLVLHNFPRAAVDLSGVRLETVPVDQGHADFDLTLWLGEDAGGLGGAFTYSVALFEEATVARLGGHLTALIRAALAEPDRSVHELPLLGKDERRQILSVWGAGPPAAKEERCLHELFEEQARRTPGAIALEGGGEVVTYAELDRRAERLAARLRGLGVAPEVLVGLRAERSPEVIVALLAVLKAGGAYLPLDPAYPEARLAWMIEDSRAVVLDVGSFASSPSLGPSLDFPRPANAAYVIYTSGSTGRPKGVVVEHRSIAGYTVGATAAFGLRPEDRVLQFASISFDTSGEEIFPTLASGAALVLRSDDMAASVAHFLREVERLRVTVLDLPTAFWHELAEGLGREGTLPACVRLVVIGGERALPDRLALWRERVDPGVRLLNTYGPTEATIVATRCDLTMEGLGEAPIGRPIPGARAYVLDRRGGPAPVGVPGELHVGGSGLARGYLDRPEITAERFVPDPFSAVSSIGGDRMYRTGDLVRWRPEGELEFLGRVDQQVKIRGFRVELGEIEAALRAHDGVRDAAVKLQPMPQGGSRLVAYLVREGEPADPAELRSFLLTRLPEYMVPVLYLDLSALPLTPSGKVDRRSLPEPRGERPDAGAGYVAPRTELERTIAAVWRDLLGIDRIGAGDNFFDLGAHSLLIVRAHGRLREALGRELTVIDLFRNPSVEALARHLASAEDVPAFEQVESLARRQKTALQRQQKAMKRLKAMTGG